ncbi:MAG: helix-turn-helix domain-containing protein [Pseudomonadota bacterium]
MTKSAEIAVLVLDQTNTLSLASAIDPLRAANRHGGRLYNWRFATPGAAPATLTSGLTIPPAPLARITRCDGLIVLASFARAAQVTPALCASLVRLSKGAAWTAAIDGGPWVLAQAGLLNGHRATTHWEELDTFAKAFPATEVQNVRFARSGTMNTAAGAGPALDLMLDLISETHGAALSAKVRAAFIQPRTLPGTTPQRADHGAIIARATALMEAHLENPLSIAEIARQLGLSMRALQHRFQDRLGTTPQAYALALRLDEAQRQVIQTTAPLGDIALATGFSSQASFARAYRARFGTSARAARQG